jgi:hypothetical protein
MIEAELRTPGLADNLTGTPDAHYPPIKGIIRIFVRFLTQCSARCAYGFRVAGLLLACSFLLEPIRSLPCSARVSLAANYVSFREPRPPGQGRQFRSRLCLSFGFQADL